MPMSDDTDTTARPTNSEMRAPDRRRDRMSRPSSSSPNGCDRLGGSSRCARVWADGSKGVSDGPSAAASTATSTMASPTLHHSKRIRGSRNP